MNVERKLLKIAKGLIAGTAIDVYNQTYNELIYKFWGEFR
tara:strand:+ start:220 stop:339 length:120 start_codon:yes stop_codon:yes gene_type:complete